ncbi:hypothetical protein CYLTODRAFT_330412, partial [Cylindrobasidium torrendii FP15055 ss-10]
LSDEKRRSIVRWRYEENLRVDDIAALARCDRSNVYRVLRLYHEHGQVRDPYRQQRGRKRAIDMIGRNVMVSEISANPAIHLDELQTVLLERCDID